jgi:hypothetical protein
VSTQNLVNFYYDPTSTLPPDGISVICPPENRGIQTDVISGGWRQLSKTQLILGSVHFSSVNNSAPSYTDWRLHGHSTYPIGVPTPFIEHATGKVKSPYPADYYVTYDYAAIPGRYIRIWDANTPVTPSMLGEGEDGDDSNIICWALNIASQLGRDVFLEKEYTFSSVIELPNNMRLFGRGDNESGLKLLANKCMQRYRKDLGHYDSKNGFPSLLDAYLYCYPPCITHKNDARSIRIDDLHINGNQGEFNWTEIDTYPIKWNKPDVANVLQNSPAMAGLAFTNQNNRVVNLNIRINNVHVHDFPSSCALFSIGCLVSSKNMTLGNAVSGRVLYYAPGHHENLTLYGFSRTSMARIPGPFICNGFKYESRGYTNSWPGNAEPQNVLGIINEALKDVRAGRKSVPIEIYGIDIDCRNSPFQTAIGIGAECTLRGKVRDGLITTGANMVGTIDNCEVDLVTENSKPPIFTFVSNNAQGNWGSLLWKQTEHRTSRPQIDWNNHHDWNSKMDNPTQVRVRRNISHCPEATQTIELRYKSDWYQQGLVWIPDLVNLTPQQCVPTTIKLVDCVFNNQYAQLIGVNEGFTQTIPSGLSNYPVRIHAENCLFNIIPGQPFRGDSQYPQQFEIFKMRNCRTHDGLVSEQNGVIDFAVGETIKEITTNLMWKPKVFLVSGPACKTQWIGLNEGFANENSTRPKLRITLLSAATEPITAYWQAQVSPW